MGNKSKAKTNSLYERQSWLFQSRVSPLICSPFSLVPVSSNIIFCLHLMYIKGLGLRSQGQKFVTCKIHVHLQWTVNIPLFAILIISHFFNWAHLFYRWRTLILNSRSKARFLFYIFLSIIFCVAFRHSIQKFGSFYFRYS